MPDVFTPAERSRVMARVKGRDTAPEIAVRSTPPSAEDGGSPCGHPPYEIW
jgi:hypothetical protein